MQKRTFGLRALLALFLVQSTAAFAHVDFLWLAKDIAFTQTSAAGPVLVTPRTACR